MAANQCCKTCKFWDADKVRSAAGRIQSGRLAPCLYQVGEIKLPESHPAYLALTEKAELRWMCSDYGTRCSVWEKK